MAQDNKGNIILNWAEWQFYEMPEFLILIWKNYILFVMNYFSLPVLLSSIFAPWRRYRWRYPKGFDLVEFLNTLISNFFSRIIGAIMRVILIIVGAVCQIFVIFAGAVIFLAWVLIPFTIVAGFLFVLFY